MEFWRIYRLVFAKRYVIGATMVIAAVVILIGTSLTAQKREFLAEAMLQPQENTLVNVVQNGNGASNTSATQTEFTADNQARVSDLIMVLRSSNDLYIKTADLLREDESLRVVDVQHILQRNNYFASLDTSLESQAHEMVNNHTMTADAGQVWLDEHKASERKKVVNELARAKDASGPYAAAGVPSSENEIADLIRNNMTFETVQGPLSTDNTPQIANQIKITAKFEREAEAVLYVNMLCVEFLEYNTNHQTASQNTKIANLTAKLAEAKQRLARDTAAKVQYQKANPVSLHTDGLIAQTTDLETRRDAAVADLGSSQAIVETLQGAIKGLRDTNTQTLPVDENPVVRAAETQVNEASIAFEAIKAGNDGEASDKYIAAKARYDTAVKQLAEAKAKPYTTTTVSNLIEDQQAKLTSAIAQRGEAQNRLDALNSQLAAKQAELAQLPAAQARLKDMDREIAISTVNVQQLETTKLREEELIIDNNKAATLSIVSAAHASPLVGGVASQRPKLIVYGMVLALIFGIALVITMDALDNSIHTGEDVEKLTGLPVAGIIPEHFPDPIRSPRMALLEPMSAATEAYRLLRTDLLFTAVDRPFQSLLPATAKPGQGATTTITNLAIVLAQSGRRVILVDADIRQPKLYRIFNQSNEPGLIGALEGSCSLDEALLPTGVENLALLPAGRFVTNPTEMLGSLRMQEIHEQLKGMADFVLFDTPSAIAYSDTAILSSFVDATLMIVRANSVPRGTEEQVRVLLNKARANIVGAVLNGVAPEDVDSVHFHSGAAVAALPPAPSNGSRGNGNGSGGNGSRIIPIAAPVAPPVRRDALEDDDDANAIPLPGEVPDASATTADELPSASPLAANVVPALPASSGNDAFHSGNISDSGSAIRLPARQRSLVPFRLAALVVVAGTVMGLLVLLLGGGANVK